MRRLLVILIILVIFCKKGEKINSVNDYPIYLGSAKVGEFMGGCSRRLYIISGFDDMVKINPNSTIKDDSIVLTTRLDTAFNRLETENHLNFGDSISFHYRADYENR